MTRHYRTLRSGLTLVELVTAMAISLLTVMTVAIVLQASQHGWVKAYNDANKGIELDAFLTMVDFGSTGRQSNKSDYHVYKLSSGGAYIQVPPPASDPTSVVTGDAVEFRYWDVPLSATIMDTTKKATAYRFFYLSGNKLMVDQGPYPPGALDGSGHRLTAGVTTQTLAQNVTYIFFNHTTINAVGDGEGSVRMEAKLTDPCDGSFITVRTATLLRNVWP
jgi:hypothetical protein